METQLVNTVTIVNTDILINAALQISKAINCLDGLEQNSKLSVSVITQMELFVGCFDKTELKNKERVPVQPLDRITELTRFFCPVHPFMNPALQ